MIKHQQRHGHASRGNGRREIGGPATDHADEDARSGARPWLMDFTTLSSERQRAALQRCVRSTVVSARAWATGAAVCELIARAFCVGGALLLPAVAQATGAIERAVSKWVKASVGDGFLL